jgi:hypothetical protein
MITGSEFDDIRPYYDEEMPEVVETLIADPQFEAVINAVFPEMGWEAFKTLFRSFKTPYDLQLNFIKDRTFEVAGSCSTNVSSDGFDALSKDAAYTYISNHRDIVLDALLLNAMLVEHGFTTTEVAIGDNLFIFKWIENIVRLNNNIVVKRGGTMHQMLDNARHLSRYLHFAVEQKRHSVWIAQREGRAKDSNDRTQESLIKMLAMGGDGDFLHNIEKLNIVPVSISYEFDPCDYLKAKEFQQKRDDPEYRKTPFDDQINMLTGLKGFKGRIHFQIGSSINPALKKIDPAVNRNEAAMQIAALIDSEIFRNYRLFPVNYIAYDRLWGDVSQRDKYTADDEAAVDKYFAERLAKIDLPDKDMPFLTEKLYEMYAFPVRNQLTTHGLI